MENQNKQTASENSQEPWCANAIQDILKMYPSSPYGRFMLNGFYGFKNIKVPNYIEALTEKLQKTLTEPEFALFIYMISKANRYDEMELKKKSQEELYQWRVKTHNDTWIVQRRLRTESEAQKLLEENRYKKMIKHDGPYELN